MTLIVIEGLDGAGGETQSKLLKEYFEKKGMPCIRIESPNNSTPVGQAYNEYLYEKFHMENEAVFLLCGCDVIINKPIIEKTKKENTVAVADRYITSTIAYQSANGFSFEKALKFIELMEYPRADLIIFIDISPETSMQRKKKEKENLDKHEKNLKYLKKVKEFYFEEIKRNVLGKWFIINGEKSIEEIHQEILKIIQKELK